MKKKAGKLTVAMWRKPSANIAEGHSERLPHPAAASSTFAKHRKSLMAPVKHRSRLDAESRIAVPSSSAWISFSVAFVIVLASVFAAKHHRSSTRTPAHGRGVGGLFVAKSGNPQHKLWRSLEQQRQQHKRNS